MSYGSLAVDALAGRCRRVAQLTEAMWARSFWIGRARRRVGPDDLPPCRAITNEITGVLGELALIEAARECGMGSDADDMEGKLFMDNGWNIGLGADLGWQVDAKAMNYRPGKTAFIIHQKSHEHISRPGLVYFCLLAGITSRRAVVTAPVPDGDVSAWKPWEWMYGPSKNGLCLALEEFLKRYGPDGIGVGQLNHIRGDCFPDACLDAALPDAREWCLDMIPAMKKFSGPMGAISSVNWQGFRDETTTWGGPNV